jgi:hypothetical protein
MKSIILDAVVRSALVVVASGALLSTVSAAEDASKAKKADASTASVPRLSDGHPNFSGVWVPDTPAMIQNRRLPNGTVPCVVGCPGAPPLAPDVGAAQPAATRPTEGAAPAAAPAAARPAMRAPQKPKYKPEFMAKVKDLDARQVQEDPALRCRNPGLPRIGAPDAIVQTPGQIVILYSDLFGAAYRIIPTDGRAHRTDAEETYLGESVGKWEGDTLVIEAVKFVEDTWLIDNGAFHTPNLKVVERIRFNGDRLEYQATAHDPEVLLEPWEMRPRMLKLSNKPMNEPLPCIETDLDHIVDGTHHDNAR